MKLKREIRFEPGHDCIRFECHFNRPGCAPGQGGSHGVHGLQMRFLLIGEKGAVQFLLGTGWLPEPDQFLPKANIGPFPMDLGYHSPTQRYAGQTTMNCDVIEGGKFYFDGSSLNAEEPFRVLCNWGIEALWEYLEAYYRTTYEAAPFPDKKPYEDARR